MLCCTGTAASDGGEGVFLKGRGGVLQSAAALEQFHRLTCRLLYYRYVSFMTQWPIMSYLHAGLLHHSLRNASTSGSTLRANSLRLFCSLLVHRFQPDTGRTAGTSGTTNSSREPLVVALGQLLDGRGEHHPGGTGGEGDRTTSSLSTDSESGTLEQPTATQEAPPTGSILCEALLKCCDWTFSRIPVQTQSKLNAEGRQLVGESLGILLACSTAAKQTALSGKLSTFLLPPWMCHT